MTYSGGFSSDQSVGGQGINGAVFITDITPTGTGNVGAKTFSSNGKVLESCVSDTDQVTVHVLAQTGHTHYEPVVMVAGQVVTLIENEDQTVWEGSINIDRQGSLSLTAVHEDGSTHSCQIQSDVGPEITTATFTGSYPGSQTELKAGDQFSLIVETDQPVAELELDNFGASTGQAFENVSGTSNTISITIADRGVVTQSFGVRVRAKNANGTFGNWFDTSSAGASDAIHQVQLNNRYPSGQVGAISYPNGQLAIKDSEIATVNLTAQDYDQVLFSSPSGELSIANTNLFESTKTVSRLSGGYNDSTPNFQMQLTRLANGASIQVSVVVTIAHVNPVISILVPASRLRSGGAFNSAAQFHEVTLISNQQLLSIPEIGAGSGNLQGTMTGLTPGSEFTQMLEVLDSDLKGTHQFDLVQATNLAGKVTTVITSGETYVIGGFVARTFEVPAFTHEVNLGTEVTDLSKVVVKDPDERLMTYHSQFGNQLLGYTITGPSGILNSSGNFFYWLDDQAVQNNSTGRAKVTVEELI